MLTTVMVFIPILVMELEVGQLFRDIAVAISVSVLLSLVVSVTVLPALANALLGGRRKDNGSAALKRVGIPGLDHLARAFIATLIGYTKLVIRSRVLAVLDELVPVEGLAAVADGLGVAVGRLVTEVELAQLLLQRAWAGAGRHNYSRH